MATKNMKKKTLISLIAESTGHTPEEVDKVIKAFSNEVIKEASKNGECTVPGFGKLLRVDVKAKSGKLKGVAWSTEAHQKLSFHLSDKIKNSLR
jgi:nucleoid DNA-binding protein